MIIIFFSYILILYISLGLGLGLKKWIPLEKHNIMFTILCGFFTLINLSTFYGIFYPINFVFLVLIFSLSSISFMLYKNTLFSIILQSNSEFKNLSKFNKALFLSIIIVVLLHTSSSPTLADNESYYIQTIQWFNTYGIVKGLANIHFFLGQASGWHLLQSSLNFSCLYPRLNDINGFLVIVVSFFSLVKIGNNHNKLNLFIGLLLLTIPGQILFIDSPSPDLPILLLVPIIIHLFINYIQQKDKSSFVIMFILTLMAILIKVTIAPILTLTLIAWIKHKSIPQFSFLIVISALSLLGFVIKNILISGYPFYPLSIGQEIIIVDWKLNKIIQNIYYELTTMYAWKVNNLNTFHNLTQIQKFILWINQSGISGIINKVILMVTFLFPIYFYKRKEMQYLSIFFIIQFVLFYLTSPQYRFFLPILLSMFIIFLAEWLKSLKKIIRLIIGINILFLIYTGIFGVNISYFSNNPIMQNKSALTTSQILFPSPNTQFPNLKFSQEKIGNLIYYTPNSDSVTFYQTSQGPLPCVNKSMIEYFRKKYNHLPQLRGKNLKDGFYSSNKKVE